MRFSAFISFIINRFRTYILYRYNQILNIDLFIYRIWHEGLKKVIKKLREVMNTVDKRTIWLKNNYIQQFIISAGRGPMTADAIRVSDFVNNNSTKVKKSIF